MTRRPTVIENKDYPTLVPSCYNCGSKDHFGEQCIEATMEEETFTRYGMFDALTFVCNAQFVLYLNEQLCKLVYADKLVDLQ